MLSPQIEAAISETLKKPYWRESDALVALSAVEESGMTVRGFAQHFGISAERLYRWRRRVGDRTLPATGFHPLVVVEDDVAENGIELVVGRHRIAVRRGFDEHTLARLLRLLEAQTC